MASSATNRAAYRIATDFLAEATSLRMGLLTGTTTNWDTAATARDLNFVNQITADEEDDVSYARVALTSLSVSEDDSNDRAEITFADVTFSDLSGDEVIGVFIYDHLGSDDSANPLLFVIDCQGSPATPNGEDFIVRPGADGVIHIETT